eukprot:433071_1
MKTSTTCLSIILLLLSDVIQQHEANLIGSSSDGLFVIPNESHNYEDARAFCNQHHHALANIYDPNENNMILQLVNLNFIENAYIGYFKTDSQWQWQSEVTSNPFLWLSSPLAPISSNIENPTTNCMSISRYGWYYTSCDNLYHFVCENRNHRPSFEESGSFSMNTDRKLKFDDARSLCRSYGEYQDLSTMYEEEEYGIAETLCSTNANGTNCWIGYKRG